ncbi:MAG: hypothetical protein QW270_02775 [Candidatus Bathyarchaeia archaeon]
MPVKWFFEACRCCRYSNQVFREIGIGTEVLKSLIERTGVIPKKFFKDGVYIDGIIMTKTLE